MFLIDQLPPRLYIGNQIENASRTLVFNVAAWDALFPGCLYYITVQRPGDPEAWPSTGVSYADGILTWLVPNTVTAIEGIGTAVIHCTVDTVEKNSGECEYMVGAGHYIGEVPEPIAAWTAEAVQALAQIRNIRFRLNEKGELEVNI